MNRITKGRSLNFYSLCHISVSLLCHWCETSTTRWCCLTQWRRWARCCRTKCARWGAARRRVVRSKRSKSDSWARQMWRKTLEKKPLKLWLQNKFVFSNVGKQFRRTKKKLSFLLLALFVKISRLDGKLIWFKLARLMFFHCSIVS